MSYFTTPTTTQTTSNSSTWLPYTFNAATKTVTLTGFTGSLEQIKAIKNITAGLVIYDITNPNSSGTLVGNVLTLTYETTTAQFNNTDKLEILVEKSSGASESLQTVGNTSLNSIDTKTPILGQAVAAASVPVVLTAAQLSALSPVTTGATETTTIQDIIIKKI